MGCLLEGGIGSLQARNGKESRVQEASVRTLHVDPFRLCSVCLSQNVTEWRDGGMKETPAK